MDRKHWVSLSQRLLISQTTPQRIATPLPVQHFHW